MRSGAQENDRSEMRPELELLMQSASISGESKYPINTGSAQYQQMFRSEASPTRRDVVAPIVDVGKWNDPGGATDWIGDYAFRNTDKGPYLVTTTIGRETTGATSIRHILFWMRVESEQLVPERFEAYDVPLGRERQAKDLTTIALPVAPDRIGNAGSSE